MKKYTINAIEYQIPCSWDEIKLSTYLKVSNLKDDTDEEFKELVIIETYTGIPLIDLKRMPLSELKQLIKDMMFITTDIPETPIESLVVSGDTYHVLQNLLLEEAQDYFTLEAILNENSGDGWKALPKILAVVCKKTGETLDTIDIDQRAKMFLNNVNIVEANSLKVFFYNYAQLLNLHSQLYSQRNEIFQQQVQEVNNSLKKLDGGGQYSKWLKKTLQKFLQYYIQNWENISSGTQSSSNVKSMKTTLHRLFLRKKTRE